MITVVQIIISGTDGGGRSGSRTQKKTLGNVTVKPRYPWPERSLFCLFKKKHFKKPLFVPRHMCRIFVSDSSGGLGQLLDINMIADTQKRVTDVKLQKPVKK